jgi:uncharacterized protein YjbJ (UPF0337 family)
LNEAPPQARSGAEPGAWDRLKANWTQARAHLRVQWGKLTDDQLDVIEGRRELLIAQLQQAYGISADEAEGQVAAWELAEDPDRRDAV